MASRNLDDAEVQLRDLWLRALSRYEEAHPGHHLILTCTHRSVEEQADLYAQGRTKPGPIVTQVDGTPGHMSNHNYYPSRALDFAVVVNGKVSWDPVQYEPVAVIAENLGLVAGAHWPHFKDYPHLELPEVA